MKSNRMFKFLAVFSLALSIPAGLSLGHALAGGKKKARRTKADHIANAPFRIGSGEKIRGVEYDPRSKFHAMFYVEEPNFGGPGQLGVAVTYHVKDAEPQGRPNLPDVINHVICVTVSSLKPGGGAGDKVFIKDNEIGRSQDISEEGNWMQTHRALYHLPQGTYWVDASWYLADGYPNQKTEIGNAGRVFVVK